MANTIDKRIVEMQFDNKQFENGIGTSLTSLDKLKKGLNLDASAKSLINLENAGRSFSLAGIGEGVQHISSSFSALGVIGFTILQNLTNAAIELGKKLLFAALGVDAIKTGFTSYEVKINAVKTVMSGTGETIEQVTKSLDDLNVYSDRTIYSFQDMTENISKFTNAGLSSEAAATAIMGISNVAAISGANTQEAARAMYNFGQAMQQGNVRLMDWKSIENANMATIGFKNQLLEAGVAMGTLKKQTDGTYKTISGGEVVSATKNFNGSLERLWLTTDVLNKTLADYASLETEIGKKANAAAQDVKTYSQLMATIQDSMKTGWTKSWGLVIGDLDEATALFTEVNGILGGFIGATTKARNDLLKGWNEMGGRTLLVDSLRTAFEAVLAVVTPIKEAFTEMFPPITTGRLYTLTIALNQFIHSLLVTGPAIVLIKRTFKGLFAVFDIVGQGLSALGKALLDLTGPIVPFLEKLLGFTAGIGDYLVGVDESVRATNFFGKAIENVKDFLSGIKVKMEAVLSRLKIFGKSIADLFGPLGEQLSTWLGSFNKVDLSPLTTFSDKIKARFKPFSMLGDILKKVITGILDILQRLMPGFFTLATTIADALGKIGGFIAEKIANLKFNNIVDIFNSGFLAALLLGVKSFLTGGTDVFKNVTGILDGVQNSLAAWQTNLKANTLITIAGALALMAVSVVALSLIDSVALTKSLTAMTVMFGQLMVSLSIFSKMGSNLLGISQTIAIMLALSGAILLLTIAVTSLSKLNWEELAKGVGGVVVLSGVLVAVSKILSKSSLAMIQGSAGLISFSVGLNIMVLAVRQLASMEPDKMEQGLKGIGALLVGIIAFLQLMGNGKLAITTSAGVILLATALNIMALAVAQLGNLKPEVIAQGLKGIGIMLAELAAFVLIIGNNQNMIGTAIGITILAAAVNILALAMIQIGSMSPEAMGQSLQGLAGGLLILIGALYAMPADVIGKSISLTILAGALILLAQAMTVLGKMSWDEIGRGLAVLAGSLVILAGGMYLMTGTLAGSAALFIAAAALAVLGPALKTLGSISIEQIGMALLALVGIFVVLGVAGLVMGPVVPVILSLAGAMFLFGIAALAVGAGVFLFAAGLTALSVAGVAGVATLVLLITSVVGLLPMIVEQVGLALLSLVETLKVGVPLILEVINLLLLGLIDLIIAIIPPLGIAIGTLIGTLLALLVTYYPQVVSTGWGLLIAFLTGVRDNIGEVVTLVFEIITAFVGAVLKGIPDLVLAATVLMVEFLTQIGETIDKKLPEILEKVTDIIVKIIDGVAVAVEKDIPRLIIAIKKLAAAIVQGLVEGLWAGAGPVQDATIKLGERVLDGIKNFLGINSPSKEFIIVGRSIGEGLVDGIHSYMGLVADSAIELGSSAVKSISNVVAKAADALTLDPDLSPSIRPVLDLSAIESGKQKIYGLLNPTKGIDLSLSARNASNASGFSNNTNQTVNPEKGVSTIALTQNNYSPVALSRFEIYRQTRIQLEQLRGLVKA